MKITVVNMIPQSLSGETNQDSEPNLAVNPNNQLQIAATAFTPNPSGGSLAPIFISSDGGKTWALNPIVPGASGFPTSDITLKFGGTSNVLYGGILRADDLDLNILRTSNYASSTPMTVLVDRASEDQPWVQATTATGVAGNPDRVYIGNNDFNTQPKTATIDQSLSAATAAPPAGFGPITIASRTPSALPQFPQGQNGPSIRPVIHSSGRIYAAYFNWTAFSTTSMVTSDVVVCRDDNWGSSGTPYAALVDPGDGLAGVRVVRATTIPWENNSFLGQERVGSHLSIIVDPNNENTVYLAWADYPGGAAPYTIHLRSSSDGGVTWSADLRTIANGINPALAINSIGNVGFLYQTLTGGNTWETHIEISTNGFATAPSPIVLATVPSNAPTFQFLPYLGDYIYLTAVGETFYGVFSANNAPDNAHFPNGVTFLRNANFTTQTLLNVDNTTPVAISIDPFFFSIDLQVAGVGCAGAGGGLQVVGVGSDGKLWHTIRDANGNWQGSFGLIESQSSGGPPTFTDVACGSADGQALQVVGVGSDGNLWHTIRNANGSWQASFGLIEGQSSGGPPSFKFVGCAGAGGGLQVVGVGSDGKLWHTIRDANGSWQASFGLIESQSSGGPPTFTDVACGSADGQALQVVGVGSDGNLWHTIRNANGSWQASFGLIEGQSSGGPPSFKFVGCAGAGGGLQVVGVGSDGKLWHTIRDANGSWQASFGLIESQSSGGPPTFTDVACGSADGQALQVVGVGSDGNLWHTIRNANGSWQASFGLIESQSSGGPPSF